MGSRLRPVPVPLLCLLLAVSVSFFATKSVYFGVSAGRRHDSGESHSLESAESKEEVSIENVSNPLSSEDDDSSEEVGSLTVNPNGSENNREGVKGAQVFRVMTKNKNDRRRLKIIGRKIYLDTVHTSNTDVDILVRPSMLETTRRHLRNANLEYEVLIEDVQRKIDLENPSITEEEAELVSRQGHKLTFDHYHPMDDMHGYLDYLAETYKEFVTLETIGMSNEKRPLKLVKISSGYPNATAIWIDGGIHAREWISPAVTMHITRELTEYRDNLPPYLRNLDYYILPMVNPDGYEYTRSSSFNRLWRKNRRPGSLCNGVDLNRNWGYKWGGQGTSSKECSEIFRGPTPSSEPETKAVSNYIVGKIPKIQGFVTFHSYGQYILYPWGYDNKVPPDYQDLQRVGDTASRNIRSTTGKNYKVGSSAQLLYPAAGASDDWAKARGKIKYTYTVELRDEGSNGFLIPASEIVGASKDGFEVIKAIAEALAQSSPYAAV